MSRADADVDGSVRRVDSASAGIQSNVDAHVQSTTERRALLWLRLGSLAAALAALAAATFVWGADAVNARIDSTADAGWGGVAVFVGLYALATVMLVPGSATTVTAGIVYGPAAGGAVTVAGATIGAVLAYGIARGVGRRPVEALVAPRARDLDRWVADRQFRSIVVLRLLPIVPFSLFNYAAGLSSVRPRPYAGGTVVGIAPGAFILATVGGSAGRPTSPVFIASVSIFAIVSAASVVAARRWTRR